jgi:deoxyadenosine/deoxycytidine kinase
MSIEHSFDLKERLEDKPLVIGIIGPTGAGKSTFSKLLGEKLGIEVVEENFTENPYLKNFYEKPREFSYLSQEWFLNEKVKQLADLDYRKSVIIDPALEMDLIYAETLHKINFMSDSDFEKYKRLFTFLREEFAIRKPDLQIVVNAKPPVLEERIKKRGRESELIMLKKYPSYLANLYRSVESFHGDHIYVNAGQDNFNDEIHMEGHIEKIKRNLK